MFQFYLLYKLLSVQEFYVTLIFWRSPIFIFNVVIIKIVRIFTNIFSVFQVDKLIGLKQFELAETINKMTTEGSNDLNYAVSNKYRGIGTLDSSETIKL